MRRTLSTQKTKAYTSHWTNQFLALVLFFVGLSSVASAQSDSPYSYNGSCATQSNWTQSALIVTEQLEGFITKIKDDPNCKLLPQTLQEAFGEIQSSLTALENSGPSQEKASLTRELGALTSFSATGGLRESLATLLASKLVRRSSINASQPVLQVSDQAGGSTPSQTDQDLENLKERSRRAFLSGLSVLDRTVDQLPQVQQCLVEDQQFGQFLASTLQLVGSFAASGEDSTGMRLATTVSKLVNYSREIDFARALRHLKGNELMASLSCVLEVTTENYCHTRDAKIVFDHMMKKMEIGTNANGELRLTSKPVDYESVHGANPLEGYYILSRNLPRITKWLQVIQIGVEPRTINDSAQKNKPLDELNTFLKSVNDIKGQLNTALETLAEFKTPAEKKNQVLKMVLSVSDTMEGSRFSQTETMNFYTLAYQPMHIPFRLIGIETPEKVAGTTESGFQQQPKDWLEANFEDHPAFADPDGLAQKISYNLNDIIRKAEMSAITYYMKWFIIDKVAIVNEALVGTLYSAKESLTEVDAYLERLEQRIQKHMTDWSMLSGIRDTRTRIQRVLKKFDELERFGRLTPTLSADQQSEESLRVAEDLILEVYEQFYVMLAKSGWLSNRMIDFIEYDFNIMQRANIDFTPYIEEVYTATQREFVDQIISMAGASPSAQNLDFATALTLGKRNIEALEMALAETYVDQIVSLNQRLKNSNKSYGHSVWLDKNQQYWKYSAEPIPGRSDNPIVRHGTAVKDVLGTYLLNLTHVYDFFSEVTTHGFYQNISSDTEFDSARIQRDKLCVQTLAFNNLKPFWYLCQDAKLETPYNGAQTEEIKKQVDETLDIHYIKKAWEEYNNNKALNHSLRICGMRDHVRKNLVLWLLHGQTRME